MSDMDLAAQVAGGAGGLGGIMAALTAIVRGRDAREARDTLVTLVGKMDRLTSDVEKLNALAVTVAANNALLTALHTRVDKLEERIDHLDGRGKTRNRTSR